MSYNPSHRRLPRQERWPDATPDQAWPAYVGADGYRDAQAWETRQTQGGYDARGGYGTGWDGRRDYDGGGWDGGGSDGGGWDGRAGYETATRSYPVAYDDYRGTGGYPGVTEGFGRSPDAFDGGDGFDGRASSYGSGGSRTLAEEYGYRGTGIAYGTRDEYAQAWGAGRGPVGYADQGGYTDPDRYADQGGYADPDRYADQGGYTGPDGYADRGGYADPDGWADGRDYAERDDYAEPVRDQWQTASGPMLVAPDTKGELGWLPPDQDRPEPGRRGLIIGAVTGFLAAAVAIGVSTLAAAFVRPQASPVIAVGGAFIDRTPSALKNFAIEHFGENDKTVLLLGMYAMIAVIAMIIGCLARRNATAGVAGIAVLGLFGAFVAVTRPESHLTDVVPSVIGGLAGIAAFLWLASAAAPVTPLRHPRARRHREAW
ncbi:MAG: hypothetical protein ACRDOB_10090 [Streptosporangiaceae bacterium]